MVFKHVAGVLACKRVPHAVICFCPLDGVAYLLEGDSVMQAKVPNRQGLDKFNEVNYPGICILIGDYPFSGCAAL